MHRALVEEVNLLENLDLVDHSATHQVHAINVCSAQRKVNRVAGGQVLQGGRHEGQSTFS